MIARVELDRDPLRQFDNWFRDAVDAGAPQPDAMALGTVSSDGLPSVRYVLLKAWDENGFVFYTDARSQKGRELEATRTAACALYWQVLHRQVRWGGAVTQLTGAETEPYWETRPHEFRAATVASQQSGVISGRDELERRFADVLREHEGSSIPLPDAWRGYRVRPDWIEFWQGMPNRLHDRLRYVRAGGLWRTERLAP